MDLTHKLSASEDAGVKSHSLDLWSWEHAEVGNFWELFRGFPYTREYARDGCCSLLTDVLYEVILTNCSLGFQLTNKIKCLRATLE